MGNASKKTIAGKKNVSRNNVSRNNVSRKSVPKKGGSNKALVWLTLAFVIIIAVIVLGIRNQSAPVDFEYESMPMLGSADAPVKIVEFGDFKCPTCQYFAASIKTELVKDYVDSGKVAIYFANFTIISPDSSTAAEAGLSVFHQNKEAFWPYYDALYANQKDEKEAWATPEYLVQVAKDAKLDIDYDKLKSDLDAGVYRDDVKKEYDLARRLNVGGTPTLFLNGKELNVSDSLDYAKLKNVIDDALK
ncbi:DsbA family protein [Paenibacillus beijingensis]|uniref:DsbA family protein n=1 Tax=Paenibacillus beijingensis TaxID=1126833 RepID=UPI000B0CF84F|nr:DsbA family protein [Paenibacillus beijingensis]